MADAQIVDKAQLIMSATATPQTKVLFCPPMNNGMLAIGLPARAIGAVTITWNGTALTLVPGSSAGIQSGNTRRQVEWHYLLAPASGSHTLSITTATDNQATAHILWLCNVDQTNPFVDQGGGNFAKSSAAAAATSISQTLSTVADALHLDVIASSTTPTKHADQVLRGFGVTPTNHRCSEDPVDATMSWTMSSGNVAQSAIAIRGAVVAQPDPADYSGSRGSNSVLAGGRPGLAESLPLGVRYIACGAIESGANEAVVQRRLGNGTAVVPFVYISANALTAGNSVVLRTRENGVNGGASITINPGDTGLKTGTGTQSLSLANLYNWQSDATQAGVDIKALGFHIEGSDGTYTPLVAHGSSASQFPSGATNYANLAGQRGFNAAEAKATIHLEHAAVASLFRVAMPDGNTSTGATTHVLRGDGVDLTQHVDYAGSEKAVREDATHTDSLADGTVIDNRCTIDAGTGTHEVEGFGLLLKSALGESGGHARVAAGSNMALPTGVSYSSIFGTLYSTTVLAEAEVTIEHDYTAKRLASFVDDATGTGICDLELLADGVPTILHRELQPGLPSAYYVDKWRTVHLPAGTRVALRWTNGSAVNTMRPSEVGLVLVAEAAGGGGLTVDTTPGNAGAAGAAAAVILAQTIAASIGDASASGAQAQLVQALHVSAAPGTAAATGATAQIIAGSAIVTAPGNAAAAGAPAQVALSAHVGAAVGNAMAEGATAVVLSGSAIAATPGNAVAAGATATVSAPLIVAATPGGAAAAGAVAQILATRMVNTGPGNAAAAGAPAQVLAAQIIVATPGNAAAAGASAQIATNAFELPPADRLWRVPAESRVWHVDTEPRNWSA